MTLLAALTDEIQSQAPFMKANSSISSVVSVRAAIKLPLLSLIIPDSMRPNSD